MSLLQEYSGLESQVVSTAFVVMMIMTENNFSEKSHRTKEQLDRIICIYKYIFKNTYFNKL